MYQQQKGLQGRLVIIPRQATLIRDAALIAQMDPYVIMKIGSDTQKSKANENGGKNPVWNEVSILAFLNHELNLVILV